MAWKVEIHRSGAILVFSDKPTDKQVLFGIASDRGPGLRRYGQDVQRANRGYPGRLDHELWRWTFTPEDIAPLAADLCTFYVSEAKRFEATAAETRSAKALLAKLPCTR